MKPLCIYHGSCNDGFGAAMIVYNYFKGRVDLWRGKYNAGKVPEVHGRDVFIVDFSYKPEDMDKIQQQSRKLVWLDHHVGAIKDMAGFKWRPQDVNGSQDNPMLSGVGLTWNYFHGEEIMPDLYKYIQDWDTWKFLLGPTRAVHFALHSHKQEMPIWTKFLTDEGLESLIKDGQVLLRKHDMNVEAYVRQAFMMEIAGYRVPMVNAPADMASDVGNILSKGHPFAGIFFDTENGRSFSIRSQPDGADVSEIAKKFGGGGHKHSAGFQIIIGRAPVNPRT